MVKIKICGVTSVSDALQAAELGADAVGLNFYSGSPRYILKQIAAEIVRELPPFVEPVGVFVNDHAVQSQMNQLGLRTFQWLGRRDRPPLDFTLDDFRKVWLEKTLGRPTMSATSFPELRDDDNVRQMITILNAMTEEERAAPETMTPQQLELIASHSQTSFEKVTQLLDCFRRCREVTTLIDGVSDWSSWNPDMLSPASMAPLRQWRVFSILGKECLTRISGYVQACKEQGQLPAAILVDAHVPGSYGGTGQTLPWELLADFSPGVPLILAGGLNADNVAQAIRLVRPYAVDVASGVESSPGKKDADRMKRFVDAVRQA